MVHIGLCEPGLFRLAGHHGKQTQAEEALDSGETLGTEVLDGLDIHTVAAVLKSFLRQLPDPVRRPTLSLSLSLSLSLLFAFVVRLYRENSLIRSRERDSNSSIGCNSHSFHMRSIQFDF